MMPNPAWEANTLRAPCNLQPDCTSRAAVATEALALLRETHFAVGAAKTGSGPEAAKTEACICRLAELNA